jgi:hypothetical protein
MATCFRCGAETQLHNNETPVCVACMDTLTTQSTPIWTIMRLPNGTQLKLPHD